MKRFSSSGNVLTEYGLCLSLIALAAIGALRMMGTSISTPLNQVSNSKVEGLIELISSNPGSLKLIKPVTLKGSGYYHQAPNPRMGGTGLQILENSNGPATNVTSIDGSQWNSLGHFQIGETLLKMAEAQRNPVNRAFIKQLAEKSYFMGAAEGEIDAVKQLQWHDPASGVGYGKTNALEDIKRLQQDILAGLKNPPSGLSPQVLRQVEALSLDSYNIGQTYVNALKDVSLNTQYSFLLASDDASGVGNGKPGQALLTGENQIKYCLDSSCGTPQSQGGPKVEEVFSVAYLRTVSTELLSDAGVAPQTVVATFNNGTHMDHSSN